MEIFCFCLKKTKTASIHTEIPYFFPYIFDKLLIYLCNVNKCCFSIDLICNFNVTGPSGPRFSDSRFSGEFPPQRGLLSDYPGAEYGEPGFGGYDYPTRQESLGSGMDQRPYSDGMGHRPAGIRDSFGSGGGKGGYGRGGLLEDPVSMYPDEYHGNQMRRSQMNRPMDKALERPGLMGAAPETSNLPNTLLTYLVRVTFLAAGSSIT